MVMETLENLKQAIVTYDKELAIESAKRSVDEKIDPIIALDAMTEAIRQVGDGFTREELWLPELIAAANAMQGATQILEEELKRTGAKRKTKGVIVIGTVFGDIHDIGKNMVCTLLTAGGFEVHDIGVNIKAEEFVEAVNKYKPEILAMSSLLTTAAQEMRKTITTLKQEGNMKKLKIIVGGGAINKEFAQNIGADGYEPTAPRAVKLAERILGT